MTEPAAAPAPPRPRIFRVAIRRRGRTWPGDWCCSECLQTFPTEPIADEHACPGAVWKEGVG